jgi:hypothetical protein
MLLVVAILITGCGKEKDLRTDDEVIDEIIAVTREDRGSKIRRKFMMSVGGKLSRLSNGQSSKKQPETRFTRKTMYMSKDLNIILHQ